MTQLVERIAAAAVINRHGIYVAEILGLMHVFPVPVSLAETAVIADIDRIDA